MADSSKRRLAMDEKMIGALEVINGQSVELFPDNLPVTLSHICKWGGNFTPIAISRMR
jgi:hypothetical protein